MRGAGAARRAGGADDLFGRIGAFLTAHGLSPDPVHYGFAHAVLGSPHGTLAQEVARLIEGGYRLTSADIERLGSRIVPGTVPPIARERRVAVDATAERLAAETQMQVEGFADLMRTMHDETRGFGRDLAQSAAAIDRARSSGATEVARITGAMVKRVRDSETRLAEATDEADALRVKLADARAAARKDPLTGLANRLAFTEAYAARRPDDAPHCLALCDVDRFKRINDQHGHGVGDRVLGAIGQALADACAGQLVARHGGEEFAVLLTGVELADAAALLDGARATVAGKRLRVRDTGEPIGSVTFSAGITAVRADETAEQALERADRLLYAAKAQGRDRICAG